MVLLGTPTGVAGNDNIIIIIIWTQEMKLKCMMYESSMELLLVII